MKTFKSVIAKAACMLALTSISNSFTSAEAQLNLMYISANESLDNIRFISMEGDMLIFELRLNSLLPKGSLIRILDGENNVIYEESTEIETYNIRYKIVKNGMKKINFEISGKHFFLNQSFKVSSTTEEKIEVTKG